MKSMLIVKNNEFESCERVLHHAGLSHRFKEHCLMAITHNLGFPRIGARRELKRALEAYWKGDIDQAALRDTGRTLRAEHWRAQMGAGIDLIPVGDFAYYDHMLNMTALLGAVDCVAIFCETFGDLPVTQRSKKLATSMPSAARVRPASAPVFVLRSAAHFDQGSHNDSTPVRRPSILSPPSLALRLRPNLRPSGDAGVVAHHSATLRFRVLLRRPASATATGWTSTAISPWRAARRRSRPWK
jgi:hypothetical protein